MRIKKLKKIFKNLILLSFIVMIFTSCQTQKQKDIRELTNYIDLSYEGANKYATAKAEFNKEKAETEIGSILKIKEKDETEKLKFQNLLDSVKIEILNNSDHLKNDDELKIEITCDDSLKDYFNLTLADKQLVKVVGLQEPKDMNVFTLIDISYEGYSPALNVKIDKNDTNDEFLKSIDFAVIEDPPYERGQKINIEARIDSDLARRNSYNITKTIQEVKIPEEVGYYVENPKSLSNHFLFENYYKGYDLIKKQRENIASFVSSNINTDKKMKNELSDPKNYIDSNLDIELVDSLYSVSKQNLKTIEKSEDGNSLIFIYRVEVNNAKYKIPPLFVSYVVKSISKDSQGEFKNKEGSIGKYESFYDNILIDYASNLDYSYKTYKIDDIQSIIKTEEKKLDDKDYSDEYKNIDE